MVITLPFILLLVVLGLLICAAFSVPAPHPRISWGWLGMAVWALKVLLVGVA